MYVQPFGEPILESITLNIQGTKKVELATEDATNYLMKFLRDPPNNTENYPDFGYEIYLDTLLIHYGIEVLGFSRQGVSMWQNERDTISPLFMDACWELCTRGILRPYTRKVSGQGSNNPGFSVTAYGRQWLNESGLDDYVPTAPGRFAQMLEPYSRVFGSTFHLRAQEAVNCYNSHTFLASCSMSGAAAETILRETAKKLELSCYNKENLTRVRNEIIKNKPKVREGLMAYSDIVKYWRDSGMHHSEFEINSNIAYISLALLLRLAMFCKEQWY